MKTADIIIVGGGIAGISAAARLSTGASVIVLERENAIGYHSTGRSAAIFVRNYGNATLRVLNTVSEPELREPGIADIPILSPRGELLVAAEDELPTLETVLASSAGLERLSADEARNLVPILRTDGVVAAAFERDASDIDVDALLQGYSRLFRASGGRIETGADVQAISRERVWTVKTAIGTFAAPILVNAAGAWADEIADFAGVARIGLQPMRRSAAILPAPDGHDVSHWPMFGSIGETWYSKPMGGKLMISPADEDPVTPQDAWPDDMVLAEGLYRFEQAVTVPVTRVERNWAGLRNFVKDRTPVVGFAGDSESFFWLAAQGGYGVQTSPALSNLTADLIAARKPALPEKTVAALSPTRASLMPSA